MPVGKYLHAASSTENAKENPALPDIRHDLAMQADKIFQSRAKINTIVAENVYPKITSFGGTFSCRTHAWHMTRRHADLEMNWATSCALMWLVHENMKPS